MTPFLTTRSRAVRIAATLFAALVAAAFSVPPAAVGADAAESAPRPPQRPNILLVISDDQGYGDATSFWKTDLQTPTIDSIARNGVRFTRFRVNPLCAPTRSSIMTGLYSLEAGMWRGPGESARGEEPPGGWSPNERRIANDIILLPQLLKKAGYATDRKSVV